MLTVQCSTLRRRRRRHQPRKKCRLYSYFLCDRWADWDGSVASRARGEYLRTHFKNMREVAAALTGAFLAEFCVVEGDGMLRAESAT